MLLINPQHSLWWTQPWLGPLYLASALRCAGHPVEIIDAQTVPDAETALRRLAPRHDWVGITTNVATMRAAVSLARRTRALFPRHKIVMGGPHATAIHESLLPSLADFVVLGEAERTITELLEAGDPTTVPGLAYFDGERVRQTPPRPFVPDLDSLELPAWDLLDLSAYRFGWYRHRLAPMITSRGCPFTCVNCAKMLHDGRRVRWRSIENVMEEVRLLYHRHAVREIHFWDDNFTLSERRIFELCEAVQRSRPPLPGLRFALLNGTRADIGSAAMFRAMRRAGFYWITIAVESGVPAVIEKLGKRLDLDRVQATVRAANQAGLQTTCFFMIGLPWDTVDTIQQTIDFAKSLPAHQFMFFMALPFPGTPMYDLVTREGRLLVDVHLGYPGYDQGRAVYEMPQLSAAEMERMFRSATRQVYLRPVQWYRALTKPTNSLSLDAVRFFVRQSARMLFKGRRI